MATRFLEVDNPIFSRADFSFVGYLADCDVYGRNVEDGWGEIKDGE